MAPIPQPRLYLRVYTDGRAEYEENGTMYTLIKRRFRIAPEVMQEIVRFGSSEEFQKAQEKYPAYVQGEDSTTETTLIFYDKLVLKKIVLLNFGPYRNLKPNYPPALFDLMERLHDLRNGAMGIETVVPAINYCEMIKNRQMYVGKTISVYADMKLPYKGKGTELFSGEQVVFDPGESGGEYLYDATCEGEKAKSLRTSGTVGVGIAPEADTVKLRKQLARLREDGFSGRARVWAEGILREEPGETENYPYRYRFDVGKFRNFEQMILPFQGELEQGWIYADTFDNDADGWVVKLSQPVKRPGDWPVRLQWKNEKDFPGLKKSGRKHIVFRVIMRVHQGPGNTVVETVYFCEILELK